MGTIPCATASIGRRMLPTAATAGQAPHTAPADHRSLADHAPTERRAGAQTGQLGRDPHRMPPLTQDLLVGAARDRAGHSSVRLSTDDGGRLARTVGLVAAPVLWYTDGRSHGRRNGRVDESFRSSSIDASGGGGGAAAGPCPIGLVAADPSGGLGDVEDRGGRPGGSRFRRGSARRDLRCAAGLPPCRKGSRPIQLRFPDRSLTAEIDRRPPGPTRGRDHRGVPGVTDARQASVRQPVPMRTRRPERGSSPTGSWIVPDVRPTTHLSADR